MNLQKRVKTTKILFFFMYLNSVKGNILKKSFTVA